ncbi:polyubiquitin-tagged protein recognition complex, Npl4 component [Hesseltinella vesiculosa]|uniref:Nuclear protein localization protein 4 n=1 Tax=Hesseltinella vesiculosa TaxID=101127 RepID=A0A1X2GI39_9FUNG|nr:polyubiquitin-tagged protein recognition complex, Npl4 component [Hesseltinella vesiculosa]
MLLRVRSKDGMARLQLEPTDTFATLANKIAELLKISDMSTIAVSDQPNPSTARPILDAAQQTLAEANLKHGDMLYVSYQDPKPSEPEKKIDQDPVDDYLDSQRGLIKRSKDAKFCRHGDNAMCDYCSPLEPFDKNYLEMNKIKHMSFHAYIRSISASQQNKAPSSSISTQLPPLEVPNFKVKVPCSGGHSPWPEAICTKCQPGTITLQRQTYRMVDHVEFASAQMIEQVIGYWRETGHQRIAYLYGRYEPYLEVPLGIKATVEAIYEPPQQGHEDGVQMNLPWQEDAMVDRVANACGLTRVGVVFTDLTDDGQGQGKVLPKRHADSYFLTSLECSLAAGLQRNHPNRTRHSPSGTYGSKFVTCVISGDLEGNVGVTAYQVSETMTAMQEADIVEPSRKPSIMRVKESVTHKRYVPDVYYKFKNEYNVIVQEPAKPAFPVDYLLVNVTNGFPQQPSPLFANVQEPHPSMGSIAKRVLKVVDQPEPLQKTLSDFHTLCAICSMDVLSFEEFQTLCNMVIGKIPFSMQALNQAQGWQTLLVLLKEADAQLPSSGQTSSSTMTPAPPVSCRHCTYANPSTYENCEMCGLPLKE